MLTSVKRQAGSACPLGPMTIGRRRIRTSPRPHRPGAPAFAPTHGRAPDAIRVGALGIGGLLAAAAGRQVWQRVISMSTVPPVARLLAELLDPQPSMSVYDPGFGSGRLLRAMEQHARVRSGDNRAATSLRLFGRELDPIAFSVGAAILAAARIQATITLGDSLRAPTSSGRGAVTTQFDRVVLNPPWEQALPPSVRVGEIERRFPFGMPPTDCADWAWVQHGLAALAPAGRMAVVLDTAALSRESERPIRAAIVDADLLDAVIVCESMPERGSPSARIMEGFLERAAILVFDRAKRHPGSTMFIDVGDLISEHPFDFQLLIREVVRRDRRWKIEPGIAGIARPDEIALRRYDLRPRFYVPHGHTQPNDRQLNASNPPLCHSDPDANPRSILRPASKPGAGQSSDYMM